MPEQPLTTREMAPFVIQRTMPWHLGIGIGVAFLLLLLLMTGELVLYAHSANAEWWQMLSVIASELIVVALWLIWEARSTRYANPPVDRPLRWFLHHLARVPF